MSLFARAEASPARIKMMVYGKTGTGKTVASLQFPNPVVIDTEKGTQYYGEHFTFDRLETVSSDEVLEALDELIEDPKNYKTCIIDSVSISIPSFCHFKHPSTAHFKIPGHSTFRSSSKRVFCL